MKRGSIVNRDVKQITTETATSTSPNKKFNEQTMAGHVRYKSLVSPN